MCMMNHITEVAGVVIAERVNSHDGEEVEDEGHQKHDVRHRG